MAYYDDDDIDVHIRRGRASPMYDRPPPVARPVVYQTRSGALLEIARDRAERSRSRERRAPSPAPAPVIINNRIYNDYDQDEYEEDPRYYLPVAAPARRPSHSRRPSHGRHYSPPQEPHRDPGYMTKEDYELERTRKELAEYKLAAQKDEDEKLLKKEMELKRLKEEKRIEEEKKKAKEDAERAVKEFKAKEAEEKEKKRIEKEERDKDYKKRLEEDLKRSGMDDKQIAAIINKDAADKEKAKEKNAERPTYTRMARRYLSIETLNAYRIDYTLDADPEYVLIKRWVPEYEQDFLWNHTKEIRERRHTPMVLAIESGGKKKHHHHTEVEYDIVRREKKRSKSPGGLVTFFAGAKRG